jgi:hypothetical protein
MSKGFEKWFMECSGALKMLLQQLDSYKVHTTSIQEMRWAGKGIMEKKDHVIFYSCQKKDHDFGIGLIANKTIKQIVMDFV